MLRATLLSLMLAAGPIVAADGPILEPQWTYDAGEGIIGHPVTLGGADAARGVLITLGSGKIHLLDAEGHRRATMALDETPAAPAIAGPSGIVAMDAWGSVYCFGEDGQRRWKYARTSSATAYRLPVLADIDGDGKPEVLVADSRGRMVAIGPDGRLKLEIHVTDYRLSPPAAADLDGDGAAEIVFGTEDKEIYAFDGHGEFLWRTTANARFGRTLPLLADTDGDGRLEALFASAFNQARPGLFAFDAHTGKFLWKADSRLQSYNSHIVVDLDGDGKNEIVFGDKSTSLYALQAGGGRKWELQLGGRGIFFAPAVADLDGAGKATIFAVVRAAGPEGHSLYAVDPAGKLIQGVPLPGGGASSAALARFQGQSELNLLAAGGAGKLQCFRLRQEPSRAKILWAGLRNDPAHSGFSGSPARGTARPVLATLPPAEHRYAWHGTNSLNLKKVASAGTAIVRVVDPEGAVHTSVLKFGPDLPKPKLSYEAPASGDYRLQVRWLPEGEVPAPEHYICTVPANNWKDLDRQYRYEPKVEVLRESIPERAAMLDYIIAMTRGALDFATHRNETRVYDRAADERHYLLTLAEYISRARPQGNILMTQMENPWPDLEPNAYYKTVSRPPNQISMRMLGNEYESAALVVTNLKPESVTLRFDCSAFDGVPSRRVLEFRDTPTVLPESTGNPEEDVLPLLAEGNLLRLAPLESRKVWLTFKSADLKPGTHRATLRVGDIASLEQPMEASVEVEVLPLRLPDQHTYRHGNWLYLASIPDPDLRRKTMDDALAHGTNVFVVPPVTMVLDTAGRITGSHAEPHDSLARALRGKAFLLISGSVGVEWPKGFQPGRELADAAYTAALRQYARHMESLGFSYDDYALYTQDEPGLMGHDDGYVAWMNGVRRIKAADARIQIYANPAGGARAEVLEPIAPLIDVWQPDLHLVREQPAELGNLFRKGKYWHYEAPGDQRNLDPLGYYRMKPWVAFQMGMTGGGYWVYSSSPYWFFDRRLGTEYGSVYPSDSGPVTTKRWEASRDGIEDFELLEMLRKKAAAPALLKEAVAFVTAGQENVSDISRQLRLYTPSYAKWMEYRGRLINALLAPNGTPAAGPWRSLFDGVSLAGWDDPTRKQPAGDSWKVENGWIVSQPKPRLREDLLTMAEFGDFELEFEWRLDRGSNSGLKYRVQDRVFLDLSRMPAGMESIQDQLAYEKTHHVSDRGAIQAAAQGKDYSIAFEFQLIDDAAHPADGKHATGALYDLVAPSGQPARAAGEINVSRLVVRGDSVQHWINGVKVLDTSLRSPAVTEGLKARWGEGHPVFRMLTELPRKRARIALQHHGDRAWFRNIRIREL